MKMFYPFLSIPFYISLVFIKTNEILIAQELELSQKNSSISANLAPLSDSSATQATPRNSANEIFPQRSINHINSILTVLVAGQGIHQEKCLIKAKKDSKPCLYEQLKTIDSINGIALLWLNKLLQKYENKQINNSELIEYIYQCIHARVFPGEILTKKKITQWALYRKKNALQLLMCFEQDPKNSYSIVDQRSNMHPCFIIDIKPPGEKKSGSIKVSVLPKDFQFPYLGSIFDKALKAYEVDLKKGEELASKNKDVDHLEKIINEVKDYVKLRMGDKDDKCSFNAGLDLSEIQYRALFQCKDSDIKIEFVVAKDPHFILNIGGNRIELKGKFFNEKAIELTHQLKKEYDNAKEAVPFAKLNHWGIKYIPPISDKSNDLGAAIFTFKIDLY